MGHARTIGGTAGCPLPPQGTPLPTSPPAFPLVGDAAVPRDAEACPSMSAIAESASRTNRPRCTSRWAQSHRPDGVLLPHDPHPRPCWNRYLNDGTLAPSQPTRSRRACQGSTQLHSQCGLTHGRRSGNDNNGRFLSAGSGEVADLEANDETGHAETVPIVVL